MYFVKPSSENIEAFNESHKDKVNTTISPLNGQ